MPDKKSSIINIALIGGDTFCKEVLEKTTMDYKEQDVHASMKAVADSDPNSTGILTAKRLGLITVSDYHDLYDPIYNIQLFIILIPDQDILDDILKTKPPHIRVESYHVFKVFWNAISIEEEKLRQRKRKVETILNGIQDLISVITPDLKISYANDALIRHLGCSRDDVIGKRCHEIFQKTSHPCEVGKFDCPLKNVVKNQRHVRQVMTRIRSDGETRHYSINVFPIREKNGKISEFIEISRDITLRLKEEEEITRRLEQMVEKRT